MTRNLILMVDSYKGCHFKLFPKGSTSQFAYLESRGGKYTHTVMAGLQYILKEYLSTPISQNDIDEASDVFAAHEVPFPKDGWQRVLDVHKGLLPIKIRAVEEGTVVPTHNVLMTVESKDEELFWLVGWVETLLLQVWYPITVATQSYYIKKIILSYLKETSDSPEADIPFKLHDFGVRGASSMESAAIGGLAHLVNFMGTDNLPAIMLARKYYGTPMAGYSIPATEHSTITSWGRGNERAAYENLLTEFAKPGALLACVSDSYDLGNAVSEIWGKELKDKIVASGATLVIRPDSGNPVDIVLDTIQRLEKAFGVSYNNKGFKVLNNVRIIQGDGVDETSIARILETLKQHRYSATNIAFGMGGALLQKVDRDTLKFAYKTSHMVVNGVGRDVFKDPITDPGKRSKRGQLDLILTIGKFVTVNERTAFSVLKNVYDCGIILTDDSLDDIRNRAAV